jgi:DNA-binding Xre family transcriptional regulator
MSEKHIGSNFDDFLSEEGILEEVNLVAIKRVISYQLRETMKEKRLSKQKLAGLMKTSRSSVDRLLNPENTSITLKTLDKAAQVLGKKVVCELR